MIFKYEALQKVIESNQPLVINNESRFEKLSGAQNSIKYQSDQQNNRDYYCFIDLGNAKDMVIYSDGSEYDGITFFEIPLEDFYVEVNTEKNVMGINDGVGDETDFPDLLTFGELDLLTHQYYHATDAALADDPLFQKINSYVTNYLKLTPQESEVVIVKLLRFLMAMYTDQNPVL